MEPPHPRFRLTFSAFCVGLFANARPHKLRADQVLFVDSIDKTSVGKIDKKRLRAKYDVAEQP